MIYNVLAQIENSNASLKGSEEYKWLQYNDTDKTFMKNMIPVPNDEISCVCAPLTTIDKDGNKAVVITRLSVKGFQKYIAKLES